MVRQAEIKIDLDARCSRCGAKGAAQNGLCLTCVGDNIVKNIDRRKPMSEVRAKLRIDKMEAKVKIVEEKAEGAVVDRHLITEVKFEYEGTPAKLDEILYTLRGGHAVDVSFSSPQQSLGLGEEAKEPAGVGSQD
jgi:hypothetical protein